MARRAVALGALLFLGSCARQEPAPVFAGSWVLKFQGKNLMLLTLAGQKDQLKGTLVRPEHFSVDQEGYFSEIRPPLVERPVVAEVTGPENMRLTEGEGADANELSVRIVSPDRAEARPAPWAAPWVFERVSGNAPLEVSEAWTDPSERSPEIARLRDELLAMAAEDQAVRQGPLSLKTVDRVAAKHKPAILEIYKAYGWPKRSEFGKEAADAFWLLVQHQDHALQKKLLPDLERLAKEGEASMQNFTLLFDRVRKGDGKEQRYGNAASCVDGRAVLDPVEDPDTLAQRRAELYLPPIEEYLRMIDDQCARVEP